MRLILVITARICFWTATGITEIGERALEAAKRRRPR